MCTGLIVGRCVDPCTAVLSVKGPACSIPPCGPRTLLTGNDGVLVWDLDGFLCGEHREGHALRQGGAGGRDWGAGGADRGEDWRRTHAAGKAQDVHGALLGIGQAQGGPGLLGRAQHRVQVDPEAAQLPLQVWVLRGHFDQLIHVDVPVAVEVHFAVDVLELQLQHRAPGLAVVALQRVCRGQGQVDAQGLQPQHEVGVAGQAGLQLLVGEEAVPVLINELDQLVQFVGDHAVGGAGRAPGDRRLIGLRGCPHEPQQLALEVALLRVVDHTQGEVPGVGVQVHLQLLLLLQQVGHHLLVLHVHPVHKRQLPLLLRDHLREVGLGPGGGLQVPLGPVARLLCLCAGAQLVFDLGGLHGLGIGLVGVHVLFMQQRVQLVLLLPRRRLVQLPGGPRAVGGEGGLVPWGRLGAVGGRLLHYGGLGHELRGGQLEHAVVLVLGGLLRGAPQGPLNVIGEGPHGALPKGLRQQRGVQVLSPKLTDVLAQERLVLVPLPLLLRALVHQEAAGGVGDVDPRLRGGRDLLHRVVDGAERHRVLMGPGPGGSGRLRRGLHGIGLLLRGLRHLLLRLLGLLAVVDHQPELLQSLIHFHRAHQREDLREARLLLIPGPLRHVREHVATLLQGVEEVPRVHVAEPCLGQLLLVRQNLRRGRE
mmetsp:Transcript_3416/g.6513  ORF Transcript_3416/g.6513 Transcript_3416/m.6513 type:complete len:649 (-) Transcript_3416:170-2116(-)